MTLKKIAVILLALTLPACSGSAFALDNWYDQSWIHSHVSLSLLPEDLPFIVEQIKLVRPDAIQFHTHKLQLLDVINEQNLHEKLGFRKVATINYSGTWYPAYDKSEKYVQRINADGTFAGRWNRRHLCFNAPVFREEIIPQKYIAIPKRVKPSQVWIDECIITVNVCYCPHCLELYKVRYHQDPPRTLTDSNWGEWEQWVKFHRDSYERWMQDVDKAIHSVDDDILVTFNHSFFVEQPEAPPAYVKNLSGDIHKDSLELGLYAKYGGSGELQFDLMPGLGKDIWAGVEPKSLEQIYNDIAMIIAHGGIWNIGEFPTSYTELRQDHAEKGIKGRPADVYLDLADKGARFARERQKYCQRSNRVPYAAMLHSARTHYAHVIVNTNTVNEGDYGVTSDGTISRSDVGRINSRVYWPNNKPIMDDLIGAYESLVESHVQFDMINEDQLQDRLSDYKMLVLSEQAWLEEKTVTAIRDFVRNGGTVFACGSTARAGLNDVLGIELADNTPQGKAEAKVGTETVAFSKYWNVRPNGAKTVMVLSDPRAPFLLRNRFGKGEAIYCSANLFHEYFNRSGYSYHPKGNERILGRFVSRLYNSLLPDNGPKMECDAWVETALREKNDNLYLHIIDRSMNWKQPKGGLSPVEVSLPMESRPASLTFRPENKPVEFKWERGRLNFTVRPEDVNMYQIVEIVKD